MMPEWHQLDSSITMPQQQESTKKKTLKSSSRSFCFSTGLCRWVEWLFPRYPQYRFRWDGSSESSHLNMYCLYFTYICPGAESNDYFHGTHSIDSDEVAQVSLLIWICTVYILPTSVWCWVEWLLPSTHSKDTDEMAQVSLLIWICTVYILLSSVLVLSLMIISTVPTV